MSTNPFRPIRAHSDTPSAANQPFETPVLSDGSGSRPVDRYDLSLDVNAVNNSFQRHVSFASPPVDSTIPAASYPSSPESARSPPSYFNRIGGLPTPDYRTAIQSDPFGDLGRDKQEDGTLQQAVFNAQSNLAVDQPLNQPEQSQDRAVQDTLSRFASASSRPAIAETAIATPSVHDGRKSMDVDAFKRLLLTGNVGVSSSEDRENPRRQASIPPKTNAQGSFVRPSAPETSFGASSLASSEPADLNARKASFIDSLLPPAETTSAEAVGKLPPPAPAPRRAKSVKSRDLSPLPAPPVNEPTSQDEAPMLAPEKASKRPPAPPIARRQSQRIPSNKSDDSIATSSPTISPAEPLRPVTKPPPPPVRRQPSITPRRTSHDLAPTIEEPETEQASGPAQGSRRSSADRPSVSGSRNPSNSSKPPNPGLMNPPPLPPPRRGRGSSRSSMDGFRPSLSTLMGNEEGQENTFSADQSTRMSVKDRDSLTASNADSILAELANLQKEVDAARRG